METDSILDEKNMIVMKLLHYFITEKNYNPIILQGVENEIWLENLNENYKVIRIVSGYIHNDEQFDFDKFKTKRIVKKIKTKTLSLNINVLSIFLNLGDNVTEDLSENKHALCIKIDEEKDLNNAIINNSFPDLSKKLKYSEEGIELFAKITSEINEHNKKDAEKMEKVFKAKKPVVTYILIILNVLLYMLPVLLDCYTDVINDFSIYAPCIRNGEYYRLITGIFLHGSIMHLGLNCYALYVIGSQIENYFGKIKYIIIYLISGIIGAMFSMIFGGNTASIGASGAIFGLLGSLLYFGYHYRVFLGTVVKSQILPIILINLAIGFIFSGIDNFAHIGGLIGGIIVTMAVGVDNKSSTSEKVNGCIISILFLAFIIYMAFVYTV